jgi:hypothetical protein
VRVNVIRNTHGNLQKCHLLPWEVYMRVTIFCYHMGKYLSISGGRAFAQQTDINSRFPRTLRRTLCRSRQEECR